MTFMYHYRYEDAIKCFKRACYDVQGIARLAKCYETVNAEKALFYWDVVYKQCNRDDDRGIEFTDACLFLGKKAVQNGVPREAVTFFFHRFIYRRKFT